MSGKPVITFGIVGVTVLVFLGQLVFSSKFTAVMQYAGVYSIPENFEPWRMITSLFAHSPNFLPHILFNMFALISVGPRLESMLGKLRFSALYLLSGLGGSLGLLWLSAPFTAAVGASGAIFGLFAALLVIERGLGSNNTVLLVNVAIMLVIGFIPGLNIAWQAHLGGMLIGALIGWIFISTRSQSQQKTQLLYLLAVFAGLVLLSFRYFIFPLVG